MRYTLPDTDLFKRVNRTIDPRCEMYRFAAQTSGEQEAQNYYFHSANYLAERLLAVVEKAAIRAEDAALLDFAAGYGRFTRFFVHSFASVTTSDLDPEMMRFCGREFGTAGFASSTDPAVIAPTAAYDVVFCFSLFTHLPERLWRKWLAVLWGFVRPGGILVFSTRSPALGKAMDEALQAPPPQQSAIEAPYQARADRLLQIFGIRVTVPAFQTPTVSGRIRASVRVNVASPGSVELGPVRFEEPSEQSGLELFPAEATIASDTDRRLVTVTIPFRASRTISQLPIGPVEIPLRFQSPSVAIVEDCPGSPSLEIEAISNPNPGLSFRAGSEAGSRIDGECYGVTTVTSDFVRAAIAELPRGGRTEHFGPGEMDLFQDVFVVAKDRMGSD